MTRWQGLLRALGLVWRSPDECPHPEARRFVSDGCGGEPVGDIKCADCGKLTFLGWPICKETA